MSIVKVNPEIKSKLARQRRIAELQELLRQTDYVALSDYDGSCDAIIQQRAAWRSEVRALKSDADPDVIR